MPFLAIWDPGRNWRWPGLGQKSSFYGAKNAVYQFPWRLFIGDNMPICRFNTPRVIGVWPIWGMLFTKKILLVNPMSTLISPEVSNDQIILGQPSCKRPDLVPFKWLIFYWNSIQISFEKKVSKKSLRYPYSQNVMTQNLFVILHSESKIR